MHMAMIGHGSLRLWQRGSCGALPAHPLLQLQATITTRESVLHDLQRCTVKIELARHCPGNTQAATRLQEILQHMRKHRVMYQPHATHTGPQGRMHAPAHHVHAA